MKTLREICASNLSLPIETFIFSLTPYRAALTQQNTLTLFFAAISSDDSLTFFHVGGTSLPSKPLTAFLKIDHKIPKIHAGVAVCKSLSATDANPVIATAGRDGLVKVWDCTAKEVRRQMKTPNGQGISALAWLPEKNLLAAGTELESQGPGDVAIYIWDLTNPHSTAPIRAYTDSHTDTLTTMFFHPSTLSPSQPPQYNIITASTDGLISIFDPVPPAEDDALLLVFNNKAAVQHVCPFVTSAGTQALCVVSHDEKMSVYEVNDADEAQVEWPEVDVRATVICDYAVGVEGRGGGMVMMVGSYRSETLAASVPPREVPTVDLYTIAPLTPPSATSDLAAPTAQPSFDHAIRLQGAHGEEVVRDVWFHDDCPLILTCGEDGHVRVWADMHVSGSSTDILGSAEGSGRREKKRKDKDKGKKSQVDGSGSGRFRPY